MLSRDVAMLKDKNAQLSARNAQLISEIEALHKSPEAQEQAVREELGFVRPGEIIYSLEKRP